jgi:hypothetical protein
VFDKADLRNLKSVRGFNLTALSAKGAVFYGLDMESVQMQGAQLEGADLRSCNLRRADLRGRAPQRRQAGGVRPARGPAGSAADRPRSPAAQRPDRRLADQRRLSPGPTCAKPA